MYSEIEVWVFCFLFFYMMILVFFGIYGLEQRRSEMRLKNSCGVLFFN